MIGESIYLGPAVSIGLNFDSELSPGVESELPQLAQFADIAEWLEITNATLRWLAFDGTNSRTDHYVRFSVPKRHGGHRQISAPKTQLKAIQQRILRAILSNGRPHQAAMAYVNGRNIAHNSLLHCGRQLVVRLDIADFFPSITLQQVKKVFGTFGYNEGVQTVLALLCTDRPRRQVVINGEERMSRNGRRFLPQGAPSSPMLSNLVFGYLDKDLTKIARENSMIYSRYADDLFFSGDVDRVAELIRAVRLQLKKRGFRVNRYKTHVWHRNVRQRVTGLTVNDRPNIGRKEWKRFRSYLHYVELNGLEPYAANYVRGFVSFIQMIDPHKALRLRNKHPGFFTKRVLRSSFQYDSFDKCLVYATPTRGLFLVDERGCKFWLWDSSKSHRIDDTGNRLVTDDQLRRTAISRYLDVRERVSAIEEAKRLRRQLDERILSTINQIERIDEDIEAFAGYCGISKSSYKRLWNEDTYLINVVLSFRKRERQRLYNECLEIAEPYGYIVPEGLLSDDLYEYRTPKDGHLVIGILFIEERNGAGQQSKRTQNQSAKIALAQSRVGCYLAKLGEFVSLQSAATESASRTSKLPAEIASIIAEADVKEEAFLHLIRFDLWLFACFVAISNPDWYRFGKMSDFWKVAENTVMSCLTPDDWALLKTQIDYYPSSSAEQQSRSLIWARKKMRERLNLFVSLG